VAPQRSFLEGEHVRFRKTLMAAGGVLLPIAVLVGTASPSAGANLAPGYGPVTCTNITGGISFSPPLMPGPTGYHGGPARTREEIDIHLGGCTAAGVIFSGLNGDTAVDGDAFGVVTTPFNTLAGLAGISKVFRLKVNWYGEVGSDGLEPTVVTFAGVQAYEGLVNDPGNIGFFLGTTTNSGSYAEPGNPAGFQGFETTSPNDMPAFSGTDSCGQPGYAWPCFPSPGGSTSVTVTPKASSSGSTSMLCVAGSDLGSYSYMRDPGVGYLLPGLGGGSSGLLGTLSGNLKDDPVQGIAGANPGDYVSGYGATSSGCTTQLGVAAGSISLGNPAGPAAAKVTTSDSPSAEPMTVGEPLTTSGEPPSMGKLSTNVATLSTECGGSGTKPGNFITFEDGGSPDTLCVLKDTGAYTTPHVGKTAEWAFGSTANDIPAASTSPTQGLAINGCTSASLMPNSRSLTETSCDLASATGSFAQSGDIVVGDATTALANEGDVQAAASGSVNGYGGTDNPDPQGISYLAIVASDGWTL
jgi:hypothetical protein